MFDITQSPYAPLPQQGADFSVFVKGSVITINGEDFDFSFMNPGDSLPREAISSDHFTSDVQCRDDGVLLVSLRVPVPPGASGDLAFPPVLEGKKYGKVIDIHVAATLSQESGEGAANG